MVTVGWGGGQLEVTGRVLLGASWWVILWPGYRVLARARAIPRARVRMRATIQAAGSETGACRATLLPPTGLYMYMYCVARLHCSVLQGCSHVGSPSTVIRNRGRVRVKTEVRVAVRTRVRPNVELGLGLGAFRGIAAPL